MTSDPAAAALGVFVLGKPAAARRIAGAGLVVAGCAPVALG